MTPHYKSLKELNRQVGFFQDSLKKKGSYYNVSRLYSLSEFEKKYNLLEIKEYWKDFIRLNRKKAVLKNIDFYIHVPFCHSKCSYCSFPSLAVKNGAEIDRYLEGLIKNFKFFSPVFKEIKFRSLYIGGGTPNILSQRQFKKLLLALFKEFKFNFSPGHTRTCEFNPNLGDEEKLKLLRELGFNRVSFGVQSLDAGILRRNNRLLQNYENIRKTVDFAQETGFESVNIDLIAGFASDTPQKFAESFSRVAKLSPTGIVIYGLYPPNERYLKEHFNLNRNEYFQTYYSGKVSSLVREAYKKSKKLGYAAKPFNLSDFHWEFHNISSFKKKGSKEEYGGEFSGSLPACTFGLGPFSRSRIYGIIEYQCEGVVKSFSADEKLFSGRLLQIDDEKVRFVVGSLEAGATVSRKEFQQTFNKKLEDVFPYAVYALSRLGRLKKSHDFFRFSFKKPEDKYISGSFFAYEAAIQKQQQ